MIWSARILSGRPWDADRRDHLAQSLSMMPLLFELQAGLKLVIWKRGDPAHDIKFTRTPPSQTEFPLAHNVNSREEVDQIMEEVQKKRHGYYRTCTRCFLGRLFGLLGIWPVIPFPAAYPVIIQFCIKGFLSHRYSAKGDVHSIQIDLFR